VLVLASASPRRRELLGARQVRYTDLAAGGTLDFLTETKDVREDERWRVADPAPGLEDRRVEITGPTDRVYLNTAATCVLHDAAGRRRITVAKSNSDTTVIWNPWEAGALKLPDLDPSEWHKFLAIETVNAASNVVMLAPGAAHTLQALISVEDIEV